jgi:hypothetical protein
MKKDKNNSKIRTMKISFNESKYGAEITFTPETPAEVAQLARMTRNAKAEKPSISLYLTDSPTCHIWIKKVKEGRQINSMSNQSK